MKPTFTFRRLKRWLLAGSILPASLLSGCHHTCHAPNQNCLDPCATIVPGSLPAPNGAFVRQHQIVQTNKAEQDDFVVYLNEWYMGGRDLGPFGEYHIVQMAQRMPFTPFPIIVDVCPDPELNEHRRRVVIEKLAMAGAQDAPMRVRLGRPEAEGLFGPEAFRVYNGILFNTGQNGGNANGFGGGGFGGGGGGGFGGGFGGFLGGFPGY